MKLFSCPLQYTFFLADTQGFIRSNLAFDPKSRSITDMERAEIKAIGDFLSDVYGVKIVEAALRRSLP